MSGGTDMNLADAYLKTVRANEHLEELRKRLRMFREDNPLRATPEDDTEHQKYSVKFVIKDIPDKLPLLMGDFLYCLRSSLDQLVWALAKLTLPYPKGTQFPILDKRDVGRFRKQTAGVPSAAASIIDSLQPYHNGDKAAIQSHLLWRLNLLCNIDKHRRIPTRGNIALFNFPDFPKVLVPLIEQTVLENDDLVVSVPIDLKRYMRLDPTASIDVTFGDSFEGIECNFTGLEKIYKFVTDDVIPRFARFF